MSFDYQATEEGQFLLVITDSATGEKLGEVYLSGLSPFQRLNREVIIGER